MTGIDIFDDLGLPDSKRTKSQSKVTQLVKHYTEVPQARVEWPALVQVKYDGVHSLTVIRGSSIKIYTRTGKRFTNTGYVINNLRDRKLPDGVYSGELLTTVNCSLEELSGVVNPNRVRELDEFQQTISFWLYIRFFDYLSLGDYCRGKSDTEYKRRYEYLTSLFANKRDTATTYLTMSEADAIRIKNEVISNNGEGIIIAQCNAGWEAGHKGWRKTKIVKAIDYDLVCTGYEEGTGKYKGKVANLLFKWRDGETIKAMLGRGYTHEDAEEMFNDIRHSESTFSSHTSPIGKVFRVYALEESSKGKLRLPKVGERRIDKDTGDF